jgi:predicted DNA-binding transcriptional regulator YafY
MKKADRLFQLVTLLKSKRIAITAANIASQMHCSERTVYRDIKALQEAGIIIDGAAGVGYRINADNHIPPLMFTQDELLSILVGNRMVQALTDPQLGQAARLAEQKIRAILSPRFQQFCDQQAYRIPVMEKDTALRKVHGQIRSACEQRQKVDLHYRDAENSPSKRRIWPLGLMGLNGIWIVVAWCELRQDYRTFRFDRMLQIEFSNEHFVTTKTISMDYYFQHVIKVNDQEWR